MDLDFANRKPEYNPNNYLLKITSIPKQYGEEKNGEESGFIYLGMRQSQSWYRVSSR